MKAYASRISVHSDLQVRLLTINCAGVDPLIRALSGRLTPKPSNLSRNEDYLDENNHSVVIRLDFGDISFLFPGDIEAKAEIKMVDKYAGTDMLDVDIYQAAHHGSSTSSIADTECGNSKDRRYPCRRPVPAWTHDRE
jgi:hypothetical protein